MTNSIRTLTINLALKGGGRREASGGGHLLRQRLSPTPTSPLAGGGRAPGKWLRQSHSSKIPVSLVPPPWLELTTSEPSFSATRVSPPGTMVVRWLPVSTNGR